MARFIALHVTEEAESLLARHPKAFLLLTQIAMRASWKDRPVEGLLANQSFIGDWQKAGLGTRMEYRVAQKTLLDLGFATFKGTNKGTVATLTDDRIFSVSDRTTTIKTAIQQPSNSHQGTTNHTEHTENTDTKNTLAPNGASSASPQKCKCRIAWTLEDGFTGISDKDLAEWSTAFPAVNLQQEIAAASVWLKSNPAKRKKNHARFLTNWLTRNQERGGSAPCGNRQQSAPRATDHRAEKASREYPEPQQRRLPRL